jgi:hypothetical protein
MRKVSRLLCTVLALLVTISVPLVLGQECEYESFLDAISGNIFGDTSIFKQAVKLSGYEVWFDFEAANALNGQRGILSPLLSERSHLFLYGRMNVLCLDGFASLDSITRHGALCRINFQAQRETLPLLCSCLPMGHG